MGARLTSSPIPGRWADDGLCNGHYQPDAWHPSKTGPLAPQHRAAVALCHQCPVETSCLEWAVEHGETGIWGGTTEKERRLIGRAPAVRRDSCGTPAGAQAHSTRNEHVCEDCRIANRGYQARIRAEKKAAAR